MSHPQLLHLACILLLCPAWSVARQRYDRYRLFDYKPLTQRHLTIIAELQERHAGDGLLDFWREARGPNSTGTFMASPRIAEGLARGLLAAGVRLNRRSANVQRLVDLQRRQNRHHRLFIGGISGFRRNNFNAITYSHTYYLRYTQLKNWMEAKSKHCIPPLTCKLDTIGSSEMGRGLLVMRISKIHNVNRQIIWIDAGIHPREWIAPSTATYIISKLMENGSRASRLLDRFEFAIMPLMNPDGYEYTHTHSRFWRKNLQRSGNRYCTGVDLNRNFGYAWGGIGSSVNPCADNYRGSKAFSEPETASVDQYLKKHKRRLVAFLTLHSYGQYILIPFGNRKAFYPTNKRQLMRIGRTMATRVKNFSGRFYDVGSAADMLYEAAGGSTDYASFNLSVPYTYTIELPDTGRYAFFLPPQYIKQVGKEMWVALMKFGSMIL